SRLRRTTHGKLSVKPATASTCPSARSTSVGYQRPIDMSGVRERIVEVRLAQPPERRDRIAEVLHLVRRGPPGGEEPPVREKGMAAAEEVPVELLLHVDDRPAGRFPELGRVGML